MIIQPERGTRNINEKFYEMETRQIAMLNEIFGEVGLTKEEKIRTLVWLAGWEESTVVNVVSVMRKAIAAEAKRRGQPLRPKGGKSPRQGAKAAFDGRNGCQKCFCVTFDESNKAYAPYPALNTTLRGRKESY